MSDLASRIPLEVLFGHPTRFLPRISPDGRFLAYASPRDGEPHMWVRQIETGRETPLTRFKGFGGFVPTWAPDSRHLLYFQDSGGDEAWHLIAIDIESNESRDLTPFDGVTAQWVGSSPRHPSTILLELNKKDRALFDVYSLDLKAGHMELVAKNPGNVTAMQPNRPSWFADDDLMLRARTSSDDEGGYFLEVSNLTGDDWHVVRHWDLEDSRNSRPLTISADGDRLYCIDSFEFNAGRVTACELATGKFEVIYEDPGYDVDLVMFHPMTKVPQAVGADRDRLTWVVLDPSVAEDFEHLQADRSTDFYPLGRDLDDTRWIVRKVAANAPDTFHLYERRTKELHYLWTGQERLRDYELAEVEPYSFISRDGLISTATSLFHLGSQDDQCQRCCFLTVARGSGTSGDSTHSSSS